MRSRIVNGCLLFGGLTLFPVEAVYAGPMQSYENTKAGVRLTYPKGWIKSENVPGALVAFGVPEEKANLDMVENVMVVVQKLPPEVPTLEKYTTMYEAQRKKDPVGTQTIVSKETMLGGLPAQLIVCLSKKGGLDVEFLQVWTVKDNKAYLLTYGAVRDKYANFLKEAEGIIASLKFI